MKTQSLTATRAEKRKEERTNETIVSLFEQNGTYVVDAAAGELVIVQLVPRCGTSVHDVVAPLFFVL